MRVRRAPTNASTTVGARRPPTCPAAGCKAQSIKRNQSLPRGGDEIDQSIAPWGGAPRTNPSPQWRDA
eukprot:1028667-Prymnesium_polylepis.1